MISPHHQKMAFGDFLAVAPVLSTLVVAATIPHAARTSAIHQRALKIYDEQPGSSDDGAATSNKRKTLSKSARLVLTFLILFVVVNVYGALGGRTTSNVSAGWLATFAAQIWDLVRYNVPAAYVALLIFAVLLLWDSFRSHMILHRTSSALLVDKADQSRSPGPVRKVLTVVVAVALAFSMMGVPTYSDDGVLFLPKLSNTKAGLVLVVVIVSWTFFMVRVANSSLLGNETVSLLHFNIVPSISWSSLLFWIPLAYLDNKGEEGHQNTDKSLLELDATLISCVFISMSMMWVTACLSNVQHFAFLYRYELSLISSDHQQDDVDFREALMVPGNGAIQEPPRRPPYPVSLRAVAARGLPRSFWQCTATRWTFITFVLLNVASIPLQHSLWKGLTGFPIWTENPESIPMANVLPGLLIPFLSLQAMFLTRNNEKSLWSYQENWARVAPVGQAVEEQGEVPLSDAEVKEAKLIDIAL